MVIHVGVLICLWLWWYMLYTYKNILMISVDLVISVDLGLYGNLAIFLSIVLGWNVYGLKCIWAEMYICWNVYGLKWIWAEIRPGYKVSHHLPRQRHVDAKLATDGSHMVATSAPRGRHVSTTWQPLIPTWQPQQRHMAAMSALRHLPRARHVSVSSSATSAATSSL
jgi:hypothetical protein